MKTAQLKRIVRRAAILGAVVCLVPCTRESFAQGEKDAPAVSDYYTIENILAPPGVDPQVGGLDPLPFFRQMRGTVSGYRPLAKIW